MEVGWCHLDCSPQDGAMHLLFCSLTALEMRQVATARAAKTRKKLRQWGRSGWWSIVKMLMPRMQRMRRDARRSNIRSAVGRNRVKCNRFVARATQCVQLGFALFGNLCGDIFATQKTHQDSCLLLLLLLLLRNQPQGTKRKLTGSIFVTSAQVSRFNVQPNGKCGGAQGYGQRMPDLFPSGK